MAMPNRNSSPTYRWVKPFTRLRKENFFGKYVKKYWGTAEICLNIGHRITYISLHMHSSNTKKKNSSIGIVCSQRKSR
ncbi:hypothetical protein CON37_24825 [Bacillus cereus]|nr:hypothetical protein CON37_24825 [Bacillus cereus]